MARPRTVYRAKGKYGWLVTLLAALLVAAVLGGLWLFYYLQRFLVYDKDTVRLVLPGDRVQASPISDDGEGPAATFTPVEVEIVVDPSDYSDVEAVAGKDLRTIHARFLGSDDLTQTRLDGLAAGMGDYDALVLELKPALGMLRYQSGLALADSYRVNGSLALRETTEKLKARDVYLVARLSALVDTSLATRNAPEALKNSSGSGVFMQGSLAWLDPYSTLVRDYLSDLMFELRELGFDEILFNGLYLPDSPLLEYSTPMTGTPDPVSAVSALAMYLRAQGEAAGLRVSVQVEGDALVNGGSARLGQDLELYFKIFDRVAFDVAADKRETAVSALRAVAGESDGRLLPIADAPVAGLESWVIR